MAAGRLGLIDAAAEIGPLAGSVADTGGAYLVPALTGLGSPWWDPHARGTLVGVTRGVGRAQLARAVVEAMAFQTRDVVEAMQVAAGRPREPSYGSTAALRSWTCCCGSRPICSACPSCGRPYERRTALGAALLAGLAEGVWSSLDEIADLLALRRRCGSGRRRRNAEASYRGWLRAVERARPGMVTAMVMVMVRVMVSFVSVVCVRSG